MAIVNPKNLGHKVSTRDLNWADLCHTAWGSEFYAPDHGIYEFSKGIRKDSTDKGRTGLYGVEVFDVITVDDNYPDMRTALDMSNTFYIEIARDLGLTSAALWQGEVLQPTQWLNIFGAYIVWLNAVGNAIPWIPSPSQVASVFGNTWVNDANTTVDWIS